MKSLLKRISFIKWILELKNELSLIRFQVTTQTKIQQEIYKQLFIQYKTSNEKIFPYSFEFQTFSQNGEDGIICEILRRLKIQKGEFLEIGVGDGSENNTRLLLDLGWNGKWVEGDSNSYKRILKNFSSYLESNKLDIFNLMVDKDNINETVKKLNVSKDIDVLSIDVDLTTHLVWNSLNFLKPKIVVLEYNGFVPPQVNWQANTNDCKVWDGTINMGASLHVIKSISSRKGYTFVGCDLTGTNAFFILDEYKYLFEEDCDFFVGERAKPFLVNDAGHNK